MHGTARATLHLLQWPSRQQHPMVTAQGESRIENTFTPVHKTRYYIIIYLLQA